ncbi:helix-turn-helix transcriptional regulator [Williamsia soli]|uniref:helix-turn-helix transcriptional regulator n=1 Tax=Williamsia soli TaxID=364929 RepID=UPI001EFFB6DB|nr:LuxR family transcriptional regulator [Williamsia soli]
MRSATVCVGREGELAALAGHLSEAGTGDATIVAVTGEPGIGKSSVVRCLAEHHKGPVWRARCASWETETSGAVLHQLFQQDLPGSPIVVADQILDHLEFEDGTGGVRLIVIEDAEFADETSLHALVSAVRHHRGLPLLVVLTVGDADSAATTLASDVIVMSGLAVSDVAELAGNHGYTLHPAVAQALTDHTGGSPGHVVALLDEVSDSVWTTPGSSLPAPRHVVADVRERLSRCGAQGQALAMALAILGEEGSLTEVAQLADLTSPLAAIDEASAARLVTRSLEPGRIYEVDLIDSMTRVALVELMGAHAAGEAHQRAAEIVIDRGRSLIHRVSATPMPDAELADEVEALALERGAGGAWAEAAGLFQEASRLSLDSVLRDQRLIRTADSLVAAGDVTCALALVPVLEALRETPLRDAVLAYLAIVRGRAAEAELRLGRAWDIVDPESDPDSAALIAQRFVLHSLSRCRSAELVEWADRALELADYDSPAGIEAAAIRGLGLGSSGRPDLAAEAYASLSERVHHGVQAQRVTLGRGWLQLAQDDLDGARSTLETAVATAHLGGSARITLWAYGWLGRVQFLTGDWDQALRTVAAGRVLAESSGIVLATPLLEWTVAQIGALRGTWQDADAAVQRAGAVTQDYEIMRAPVFFARAHIAEASADYGAVVRALDEVRKMSSTTSLRHPGFWPWADILANALVVDGKLDAAEEFLQSQELVADEMGHRSTQARLGYARGRLLGATGDLVGARRSFERSLSLLDGLPLRYDLARVNFAYGQTLRRAGKRGEADPVLAAARDIYQSLGATTLVERCERELRAGGVNAKLPRGDISLTPQEEAVTRLVCQGFTNREVASELFVSAKTVQYHLTHVYAKLGIRSRVDLARVYGTD